MDPNNLVKGCTYILSTGVHDIEVTYFEHTLNHRVMRTANGIQIPLSDSSVKTNIKEKV